MILKIITLSILFTIAAVLLAVFCERIAAKRRREVEEQLEKDLVDEHKVFTDNVVVLDTHTLVYSAVDKHEPCMFDGLSPRANVYGLVCSCPKCSPRC